MPLTVKIIEQKLVCTFGERPAVSVKLTDTLVVELQACCDQYHDFQKSDDPAALLAIGQTLFALINTQPAETQSWLNATGSRCLTIFSDANPTPEQQLLLHLPWEVLAEDNQFLTDDVVPFEVIRRVGQPSSAPLQPRYKDLTLAFMAADPGLNSGLNYEAEERAIFTATRNHRNLNLLVDVSGNLEELSRRLSEAGHCDVLHLSCHGSFDTERGFVLHLEDDHFGLMTATAHDFGRLRLHEQFSTLFLSACHSANHQDKHSLMIDLARLGIANIVGWDGAVADEDATVFAEYFYQALQRQATVPDACARARQALLEKGYTHWHLGRCCLSAQGGEPLVSRAKPKSQRRKGRPCHELLDKEKQEVRVASRETFVGRRRQTREALRVFADQEYAGVLLYAIGGSGKSSLAARIADRLEPTFKAAVLYRNYQPFDVLQTLGAAARGAAEEINFPELIAAVQSRPDNFKNILIELLEGVFDQQPILLVLDDLEQQVLEPLSGDRKEAEVKPEYQATLTAIIEAFDEADTESRLLLTSRYKFVVRNRYGDDVAARLKAINVPDMTATELKMHWLALQETAQGEREEGEQDSQYLQRIYDAGKGNPGLQHLLFQPLLKGETVALDRALERIGDYRATQTEQSDSSVDDLDKYLQRIALEVYSRALRDTELQLLRLLTLFDFPVPEELLLQAGPKVGIDDPAAALQRLDNFGLLNHWSEKGLEEHVSCYGLAEKVVEPLSREDRNFLAKICAPLLWRIWFKEFLEEYAVPETETLKESAEFIIAQDFAFLHYCPVCQAGKLPLSGEADQRRIAALHRFCIRNSLADWEKIGFKKDVFINSLELSLSFHVFNKLAVSSAVLEKLPSVRFEKLHKFFTEDRIRWKSKVKEHPQSVLADIFQQFSGNNELVRQACSLLFGELDRTTENVLQEADLTDKENRLNTALQLAKTDKEKAIAYGNYAVFLAGQKQDYPAAEAMYERAVEADPQYANALGNYAWFLHDQKKDYSAAEAMYLRALEVHPVSVNIFNNYAILLDERKKDYAAAEVMYKRAIEAEPKFARALSNYANFLADQKKDYAAAEVMYKRAIEAKPKFARALGNYANFLADQKKDYAAAEAMYERAVEADPKQTCNLCKYSVFIENKKEDYTAAKAMYQRAVEADPNRTCVAYKYATFLEKSDYVAAEAMYKRAVEADPNHANTLGSYANFLADQKKDYPAAEAMYERAVKADSKHARNLGNYANFLCYQKQDYPAAEAMYERAVEADPKHARSLAGYAILLDVYKKDYAAAEKMYQRSLEAAPENANCLGNYARLLFLGGDKTKAVEMLEQAERHQEKHPPDLSVELSFYRYAHCQPHPISPLKKLLLDGTRSLGWNLEDNVRRAEQDGHPNPALLAALAKVISDDEPLKTLEQFEEWSTAEPTA
jgi:Tfp pilus assembly protein PilF